METFNNDFLAHYGVRGMKWGVRREMGKRARLGATAGRMADTYRRASKLTKSADKAKQLTKLSKQYANVQKKLYKGLSDKDIRQGKRAFKKTGIIAGVLAGPLPAVVSMTTSEAYREKKINDMISSGNSGPRHGRK